jgi:hypothetical protein
LGIHLQRKLSSRRWIFTAGEKALSAWMSQNAFVTWLVCEEPWNLEKGLIQSVDLPLNMQDNESYPFYPLLHKMLKSCKES